MQAPDTKLIRHTGSFQVDVKRFSAPYVIRSTCPKCGKRRRYDLAGTDYLSYPTLGAQNFTCYCSDCDEEWHVAIHVDIVIRLGE